MDAIAYIDGYNLYYGIKKWPAYKWLDLEQMVDRVFPNDNVGQIRYFTARVKGKFNPASPIRQQSYLRALTTLPRIEPHFGRFLIHPTRLPLAANPTGPKVEVLRSEEKGSDVNLATYMLLDALEHPGTMRIVFSNDSDLREPIRAVQEPPFNQTVWVVNPRQTPKTKMGATHHIDLNIADVRDSQLPNVVTLANGKTVRRPNTWV
jgi:hypothetical protein